MRPREKTRHPKEGKKEVKCIVMVLLLRMMMTMKKRNIEIVKRYMESILFHGRL